MAGEKCSFAEMHTENLGYCPNEDTVGGVKTDINYIPMAQLATFTKPTVTATSTYEERITIPANGIVPTTGKGFKKIQLMVEESELKNALVGNKGNKKSQASFDAMIPNFTGKNLGFVDAHKNTPLMIVVTDSTGVKWVIPEAFIDKADATSGKKYEDNSGVAVTITANSKVYKYAGTIELIPDA
ncbi:hypothetical protein [Epilithonimonas hominis]|uniref:hypothetical protein n=1 Tax=Epilithonimonas hominis TaxID=420404 RepID=UPI00289B60A8|nr:hypothetical protein [Epilithonimonas hominis]